MEKVTNKSKSRAVRIAGREISNFMLKIVSIIIAVIIWFALSITQYPTINKTITKVPVEFTMHGTAAESRGLSALSYKDITVDVEVQGMNYEIGTYTANDLIASVNLDAVTREGTYDLEIDVKSVHTTDKCRIVSIKPDTVSVKFDRMGTASFPITVSAPNVSAVEGCTLKETTASPAQIDIQGPEDELERIAKVTAVYSGTNTLSEDASFNTDSLLFYDADDNLLDSSNYTLSTKSVDISFIVYRKITADLTVDFTNTPPNFALSSLPYSINPQQLQIITPQLDSSLTETLKLGTISLYEIEPRKTFKFSVDSLLTTGEINQSGTEQIEVSFDFDDYDQKTFQISADKITFSNIPSGKKAEIDNEKISGIVIFGPKDDIENLKVSDLKATVDLSDIQANGSVSHEVVIYSDKYNSIWNIGTHEAVINISDK